MTTYSYDANGALTNTVYSDGTPTISLAYNRAGRQVRAEDAAGVTAFLYDDFGLSEVIDISPGNLDSSLCFFQSSVSPDVFCI